MAEMPMNIYEEGAVLYFSVKDSPDEAAHQVLSLCKLNTLEYLLFIRLR